MSGTPITPRHAWQPLTPRGVAAFATAPVGRLWLAQLAVAILVAVMIVWFVSANWFPVVREALRNLPSGALIRFGTLHWPNPSPVKLGESRALALTVDLQDAGSLGRVADVELALHERRFTVTSLLGYLEFPYPRNWTITLARTEALAWWGAWEWALLTLLGVAVVLGLLLLWLVLGTVSCPLARGAAFFANRRLNWLGSWKLTGAAMLPAAFLVMTGLFFYGWLGMDLVKLLLFYLLHFVTTWIYIGVSPFFLPKDPAARSWSGNPFVPGGRRKQKVRPTNPFAARR